MKKKCSFLIDDRIFCRDAVMKTAYLFTGEYYVHLSYQGEHDICVLIETKQGTSLDDVDKRFGNELLAQMIRLKVSRDNRTVRELVIGRALYSSYIDFEDVCIATPTECTDNAGAYSLDDIAVDWFEVNENNGSV